MYLLQKSNIILLAFRTRFVRFIHRSGDSTEIHCLVKSGPTGRFKRKIIAALEALCHREYTKSRIYEGSRVVCSTLRPHVTEVDLLDRGDRREATGAILLTFTRYVLNFLEMAGPGKNRWRLLTSETCSSVIIEIPLFYHCIISGIMVWRLKMFQIAIRMDKNIT